MDKRIAEIRAMCKGVTDGPWTATPLGYGEYSIEARDLYIKAYIKYEDARFIASSRELVSELLNYLDEARDSQYVFTLSNMYKTAQKELDTLKQTLRDALGE